MKAFFERLKDFVTPPVFEGHETKTRNAKLLYTICWATAIPITVYIPIHIVTMPQTASRLFLLGIVYAAILTSMIFTRQGRTRAASLVFINCAWMFLSASSFTAGGMSAPAAGGYGLVIICSALLLGQKESIFAAVASVVFLFGLTLAKEAASPSGQWWVIFATNTGFLIVTTVMLVMARNSIEETFRRLHREIDERELVTAALRKSEARYKVISEISSDYTYEFEVTGDGKFEIAWVTDSFSRITGYPSFDEVEKLGGLSALIHPEDIPITQQRIAKLINCGSDDSEFRIITKDGQTIWLHDFGKGIRNKENKSLHIYGAAHEITERKQAEFQLQDALTELQNAYDRTIEGWVKALDLRDHETEGHTKRVTELTLELAETMGFYSELPIIRRGALLHDIGKLAIPDKILRKRGALTRAERTIVEQHPVHAFEMLYPIEYLRPSIVIPYCHHERWDGSGYPQGLSGREIPIFARLFAIVDVWDALSSHRPYRNALPEEQVVEYIMSESGRLFDPEIVEIFLSLHEKKFLDRVAAM